MNDNEREGGRPKSPESATPKRSERAAVQGLVGEWKAFLKGDTLRGGEIPVKPMHPEDVLRILGAIAEQAIVKEQNMTAQMSLDQSTNEDDLLARGEAARVITQDTAQGVKGELELFNFLRDAVFDGILRKTPEIFMADEKSVAYMTSLYTPDMTTMEVGRSVTGEDAVNKGIQFCLIITEKKGAQLAEIFRKNGHQVFEHASGSGFQAEMGGVRMAFLYPQGAVKEANTDEAFGIKSGGTYGKEAHA
ncbi:MAG: hypothetical protein Q7S66_04035 [bacterium]|nr:hypothetical protein [bacterium]